MSTWNASLAVGHTVIDEQHRKLFSHADDLIDAMLKGRGSAEMKPLFDFLRDYCRDHFATEEKLMAATRYLQSSTHGALHREFERQFKELEEMMAEQGATSLVVLGAKDLIRGWLVTHVGTVDVKLAAHLRQPGVVPPPAR
jgi:hemerythrin